MKTTFDKLTDIYSESIKTTNFDPECIEKLRESLVSVAEDATDQILNEAIAARKAKFISLR